MHASPRRCRRLLVVALGLAVAAALARVAHRRGALIITPASLAGAVGFAGVLLVIVVITRGRMSPSYVPSFLRLLRRGAAGVTAAIALQTIASWRVVRRAPDRLAAAGGVALVGLGIALGTIGVARAWFSPPHLDVPPPFWMVAVPALDVAAAACAFAVALTLALAALRREERATGE